jgi:ribonuclease III
MEGVRARAGDLRESGLSREALAPRRVPVLRSVWASRSASTGPDVLIRSEATAVRLPAGDLLTELGMSVDPELLDRALTHRSYAYEQGGLPTNERLEFLGDSVLGLIVTEHLFVSYPDLSEGQLAKLRAAVVNSRALADIARQLDLGSVVHLGRGEESTGGRDKSSILADTMEAVIGAVFLQHGVDAARDLIHHLFDPLMAEVATRGAGLDWKTSLQEIASTAGLGVPVYDVVESGPDHAKTFQATVSIDSHSYGPGAGRNKKEAEQNAASIAFAALKGSRGAGPLAAR